MDGPIYLDNAATSYPKPDVMHASMGRFYRECGVSPGRTGCDMALQAEAMIHETRRKMSALFHGPADPNRLVFAANATHALNLVIQGTLRPGDHVISSTLEHNSVLRPIHHMMQSGVQATFVRPDPEGYLDPAEVRKAMRPNTALAVLTHGSNVIGTVQDLPGIGEVCRAARVPLAVDAAQTAGVVPIDMAACGITFLCFTGHKGLMGPTGMGGVCVAEGAEIRSTVWGGTGVRSAQLTHLEEFPYRLEAGTHNVLGIAGLSAGVDWIAQRGMEAILRHEMELLGLLQDGLAAIPGVHLHGARRLDRRVAVLAVTVDGYDPSDVGTILDVGYGILTRTGLQCAPLVHEHLGTTPRGTVRFSIGPFNTRAEIECAVRAMAEITADRNPRQVPSAPHALA